MIGILICLMSLKMAHSSEDVIDVNDILSEDLMPTSLLIWEDPESARKFYNESASEVTKFKSNGSLTNAMETMGYHRTMMNQYLCRSYVANQIVSNMTLTRIKRRMGHATGKEGNSTSASVETEATSIIKNNLMNDEGSSGYQDWLLKTTTLEDLYRHYNHADNRVDDDINENNDKEEFDMEFNGQKAVPAPTMYRSEINTPIKHRGQKDDVFYGGGTAPAGEYQPPSSGGGPHFSHSGQGGGGGYQHSGGGGGYQHSSGGGSDFASHYGHGYIEPPHEHEHVFIHHTYPPKSHGHYEHHSDGGKEHELANLFEVTLTALAYLAFGMFLVHVVMCISAINNVATTTMASMMPMSMSPTATAAGMTGGTGMGGGMTGTGNGGGTTSTGNGGTTGAGNGGGTTGGTGGGATGAGDGTAGAGDTGAGGDTEGGDDTGAGGDTEGGDDTGAGADTEGGGDTGTGGGTGGEGDNGMGGDTGNDNGTEGDGGETTGNGGDAGAGGGPDMDGGNGGDNDDTGDSMTSEGGGNGNGDSGDAIGDNGGTDGNGDTTGAAVPDDPGTGGGATGDTAVGTAVDDTVDDDAAGTDEMSDTFQFRLKRDIPTLINANNYYINELARRVLIAIETAMIANSDQGACLKKNLCETNKWSRSLEGRQRIIVPVFSLGMSWISGRLIKAVSPATSRLDALKAAVLGLGKANCEVIYQECDLRKETSKRRLRRRK